MTALILSLNISAFSQTAETFSIFDTLLLLQRGGKQVYFGPSKEALSYFSPIAIGDSVNPAEFILEVAGAGVDVPDEELGEVADLDTLALRWKDSSQNRILKAESDSLVKVESTRKPVQTSSASIYQQCVILTKRVSRNYYRDASYSFTKFFTATVVSGFVSHSSALTSTTDIFAFPALLVYHFSSSTTP